MEDELYIRKNITSTIGGRESTSVDLEVEIKTGKAKLLIKKTIVERYPVTDYKKVMQLHEDLNRGGGRQCYTLEDLTK